MQVRPPALIASSLPVSPASKACPSHPNPTPHSHPLPHHPPDAPQVLGRSEFKQLLRWRLLVKKDMQRAAAAAKAAAAKAGDAEGEGGDEQEEEEDPEEKLLREMAEVKER